MITFQNVFYRYENELKDVLSDVSFHIAKSEFVAIVGKNGAGKTTLVKHFNGLFRPRSGFVKIDGRDIIKNPISKMAAIVGLAFQNPNHQLFAATVSEELAFGPKNLGIKKEERIDLVNLIAKKFNIEHLLERSPHELSGGERRLVSIASVLTMNQQILVLDEPTYGQDYRQKKRLGEFLQELSNSGITVIIVSHDVDFILEFVPRTIVLNDGKIIEDNKTEKIFSNKELMDAADLTSPILLQLSHSLQEFEHKFPIEIFDYRVIENIKKFFLKSFKTEEGK